jgi:hypothetical protein
MLFNQLGLSAELLRADSFRADPSECRQPSKASPDKRMRWSLTPFLYHPTVTRHTVRL